jgi:hypothetical protein
MNLRLVWGVWIGFTWLRIGIVGGLLWMRWRTFVFWLHAVGYGESNPFILSVVSHFTVGHIPSRNNIYLTLRKSVSAVCWRMY